MARLLSSGSEASVQREGDPSVLYADDERAAAVMAALSSETGMAVFRALEAQALTPSELADEVDVSVQNAAYHLSNLEAVDLVEVVDTCYSEKGREMDVYAVAASPTVLVLGRADDGRVLRRAVARMTEAIGLPAVAMAALGSVARGLSDLLEA